MSSEKNRKQRERQVKKPAGKGNIFTRLKNFFSGLRSELKRVSWPDRKKLRTTTAAVLAIILLSAAIIFIFDKGISLLLNATGFYTPRAPEVTAAPTPETSAPEVTVGAVDSTGTAGTSAVTDASTPATSGG